MALEDFRDDMATCCRCSACKFVPLETLKDPNYVNVCPSIARFDYRAYSGGGRLGLGMALLEGKLGVSSKKLQEVIYNCQMCGACDVSCKYAMDMEVLDPMNEIRAEMVRHNNVPSVLEKMITLLAKQGTMVPQAEAKRGTWARNLKVKDYTKESVDTIYFAGCRTSANKSLWNVARSAVAMMQLANVNVGIARDESCCGGRAYQIGYQSEAIEQARRNMDVFRKAGVKTLVTGCAECYYAFKVLYDRFGLKGDLEVYHTSEYFSRLIGEGKLKPSRPVNKTVTYHDPCHLGRQGEPYIHWKGKRKTGQLIIYDPPKEFRRGNRGVYDAPRDVLKSIPGLTLVEMERHKEYSWCCGAGGGVREYNPEYAFWTAAQRIGEAENTPAEVIASGCPGCETLFREVIKSRSAKMKVCDVVELLAESIL